MHKSIDVVEPEPEDLSVVHIRSDQLNSTFTHRDNNLSLNSI